MAIKPDIETTHFLVHFPSWSKIAVVFAKTVITRDVDRLRDMKMRFVEKSTGAEYPLSDREDDVLTHISDHLATVECSPDYLLSSKAARLSRSGQVLDDFLHAIIEARRGASER